MTEEHHHTFHTLRIPLGLWRCGEEADRRIPAPPPSVPPPPPTPPEVPRMRSFMDGILTPFINCVQPPIQSCVYGTPTTPTISRKSPLKQFPSEFYDSQEVVLSQPLTNIQLPHENDVLCGRGGNSIKHPGNQHFRDLIAANKGAYSGLTKKQKMLVAKQIVDLVRSTSPPGRFLAKDPNTGLWYEIGQPRSLEKTSQALRDKAASDRAAREEEDELLPQLPVIPGSPATPKCKNPVPPPPIAIPAHLQHLFNHTHTVNSMVSPSPMPSHPMTTRVHSSGRNHSPSACHVTPHKMMLTPPRRPVDYREGPAPPSSKERPSLFHHRSPFGSSFREQFSSPDRQQDWKRQRTTSTPVRMSSTGLATAMESHLSLHGRTGSHLSASSWQDLASPSRTRSSRFEDMDGLAALSTAAFLRLDETD